MRSLRWTMYLFLGLGSLILILGVALAVGAARFQATAVHSSGTVIELVRTRGSSGNTLYTPVVRYAPPGQSEVTFIESGASSPPEYSVGESVEVLYPPGNPQRARLAGFMSMWFGPVMVAGMGFVFASIGLGFILYQRWSKKKKDYLMAYGTAVDTEFQAIERNQTLKVNGRNPWRIVSQWRNPASGNVHVFNSENLWFDPTEYGHPEKIKVLLDPKDESRYYMDVSFLPKLAES